MTTRPRGICVVCGQTVTLKTDGTVRGHGRGTRSPYGNLWCPGSWMLPSRTGSSFEAVRQGKR